MLIDSHCHLVDEKIVGIKEMLKRAKDQGVEKIIVPCSNLGEIQAILDLIRKQENVWGLVGIDPEGAKKVKGVDKEITKMEKIVEENVKILGIGEIGLDFYYDEEKKTKQIQVEVFKKQLELATRKDLPVVIHMREAEKEMWEILKSFKRLPRGQFHCWSGSIEFLKWVLGKSFMISFGGNLTYKGSGNLRGLIKWVPMGQLLLETDSPYLSPEGRRGKINEPANVKIIGRFIAELLNIDYGSLIKQIRKNTVCLFY